jgi:fatty-acyl-CoA synthase
MQGLMMDFPLTLAAIFRRAETLFGGHAIVTRQPDKTIHRYSCAEFASRTRRLARALQELGVQPGDRVATLAWNHYEHLEAYFAAPIVGAVLHTLNLRLPPDELVYIINHAEDRVVFVDRSLLPLFERLRSHVRVTNVVVIGSAEPAAEGGLAYESLLESAAPLDELPALDERTAAALCYTTGTTGRPKGVLYSHRSLVLHSMGVSLGTVMAFSERDVIMPVVPMFHANAWGLPYAAMMAGSKLVLPGPHLDPASLAELCERERVTIVAGVPTIWMGLLQWLDACGGTHDLTSIKKMLIGGAAVPQTMIEAFEARHGLKIIQGWGMTEMSPVGTIAHLPPELDAAGPNERYRDRAKQGRPLPFVEIRARNEEGLVPWDGHTMGELEVRGPWVASAYFRQDDADRFTPDGWFKTGDIVTIDQRGTIDIQDRTKDLIKSGGEWISSIALENALMGHPAVAEAAVVAIAHPKWSERPLAAVVLKNGATTSADELRAFLAPQFPKFWLPDAFEFVDAIPRTAAGKFLKSALRKRFKSYWAAV